MRSVIEREPIGASEFEQPSLDKIEKALRNSSNTANRRAKLITPEGEAIELPDSVFRLLILLVFHLAHGRAVNVMPVNKEMTTQEAADILNVSRPYLVSLLEKGEISFKKVGTHRRIKFEDLMSYKRKRDAKREKGLAELTQLSQEIGVYD